jgi:hypothetical protein
MDRIPQPGQTPKSFFSKLERRRVLNFFKFIVPLFAFTFGALAFFGDKGPAGAIIVFFYLAIGLPMMFFAGSKVPRPHCPYCNWCLDVWPHKGNGFLPRMNFDWLLDQECPKCHADFTVPFVPSKKKP